MVRHPAGGRGRAGVLEVTGIDALLSHAGLVARAIVIDLALYALAADEWVTVGA